MSACALHTAVRLASSLVVLLLLAPRPVRAEDWPMWRHDPERSGTTPEELPPELHIQWVRHYPPLEPAFRSGRLAFDAGYEPIVLGGTVFVASSRNDSLTALDLEDGSEKWRYHAGGPIRFAPVAWRDRVAFGSDDGVFYCLDAASGNVIWERRAVPSHRKVLGNRRLVSAWPIRGGVVLDRGTLYFAAGVWPFEGVFIHALDAETGATVWTNDRSGSIYGVHPHDGEGFGGLSPQGYIAVNGDELIVPCGTAYPARLELATGALVEFSLPSRGRFPGGWFAMVDREASRDIRRGRVTFDSDVNSERHEDNLRRGHGVAGARTRIAAGGVEYSFGSEIPGVAGEVCSMAAASRRLLVVTREGGIYCFGGSRREPTVHELETAPLATRPDAWASEAHDILERTGQRHGYALVLGIEDGRLVEELILQSELHVIAIDSDPERVNALRRTLDRAGVYGTRASAHAGEPLSSGLPPYISSLVASEAPARSIPASAGEIEGILERLRPHGGTACFRLPLRERQELRSRFHEADLEGTALRQEGRWTLLSRPGALPGSVNYTGGWSSPDALVRAPLGVLWFDDTLGHFKRSPQPRFIDGIMVSRPKEWLPEVPRASNAVGYELRPPVFSDMYTGRVLSRSEVDPIAALAALAADAPAGPQPVQYRPPTQKDAWRPEPPAPGIRVNPMTGREERRTFPKSYGCDGGIDYGFMYTMRSATPAYYDKSMESGTINISGPRSGCTNSIIPAGGILNVPYFYEGCTCSYPLPASLALVAMPETFEQWTSWGEGPAEGIARVGLNFGAPGDRVTRAGTLWLEHPRAGGPSPDLALHVEPDAPTYYYRHSLRIRGGRGWPWVAASGVEGLSLLRLSGLEPGAYTVRLYFAEPEASPGERVFTVGVQGAPALENLDVAAQSGGPMRALVRELRGIASAGSLELKLSAVRGATLLCGMEVVAEGLSLDALAPLDD